MLMAGAATANGRGQKRDNTKQTTLFGLPAVPAPEKPEKRSRKKGGGEGVVPSEGCVVAGPETGELQDVEMTESQNAEIPASQAATVTAVDSQQESQATEVITTQEGSPEPIDWPPSPPPMGQNLPDEICTN
jgi:chromosome transmission fidelity protein 4